MSNVANRLRLNHEFSKSKEFVPWLVKALWAHSVRVFRWHCAGDISDTKYAEKILTVIKKTPKVTHYLYTRSWRIPEIAEVLARMCTLKNVHVWYSADVQTGTPPRVPGLRGIAWMARNAHEEEQTPAWADLVFRDKPRTLLKKANGVQVCANEIGLPEPYPRLTCTQCQICFRAKKKD